ncbi:MAG: glycosyltransferase family 4 protein, partial [Cytophagales bacterium]
MHILLVHQYFLSNNQGGGSRFNELTKFWQQKGVKITVISGMVHYNTGKKDEAYKGKKFVKEVNENGINVWRCHVSESYNSHFLGRLWAYFSFVFYGTWCAFFKAKENYDLVLVTSPPLFVGIMALLISKFKKIPFVFEIRDLWPESAIDTGVLTNKTIIKLSFWLEKLIYKKASLINCLTPAFESKLIEEKNVPKSKVVMIPNAADFSIAESLQGNFDPIEFRKTLGWNGKLVILYVGAHGVANHLIQVLQTAELLSETNVHFVLIGDGMQKKMLMETALQKNLKNVEFLSPVSKQDIFKYISACDIGASVLKNVDTFKTVYSNKT